MWRDDRDEWIIDLDDTYKSVSYNNTFGGQWYDNMCISSNGPVYFGDCPASDWKPKPLKEGNLPDQQWTGVSAFWSDFAQGSRYGWSGGNIYYRYVNINDPDTRSIKDLVIIANRMKVNEVLREAHIITFHKMADNNRKKANNKGNTFQYVIVPMTSDNPYILLAYGELGWDNRVLIAGLNALDTPNAFKYNFITDDIQVNSMPDLARRSFFCNGPRGCKLVDCQQDMIYDFNLNQTTCGVIGDITDLHEVGVESTFSIDIEQNCDPEDMSGLLADVYPQVDAFLDYAYQWSDVNEVVLQHIKCVKNATSGVDEEDLVFESHIEVIISAKMKKWIDSGLFDDQENAMQYIQSLLDQEVQVPLTAMEIWDSVSNITMTEQELGEVHEFLENYESDLNTYNRTDPTVEITCGWGAVEDADGNCQDINECDNSSLYCGTGNCLNINIGYICTCDAGFIATVDTYSSLYDASHRLRGPFTCEDINECESNSNICGAEFVCSNTVGSYECVEPPSEPETPEEPPVGPELPGETDTDGEIPDGENNVNPDTNEEIDGETGEGEGGDIIQELESIDVSELLVEQLQANQAGNQAEITQAVNDLFDSHGCWCSSLDDDLHAKTRPVDSLDMACRELYHCRKCARRRAKILDDGLECEADVFNAEIFTDITNQTHFSCSEQETCEAEICDCALNFASEVAELLPMGFSPDVVESSQCEILSTNGPGKCVLPTI